MSFRTKASLATFFEQGDKPSAAQFQDLIDSIPVIPTAASTFPVFISVESTVNTSARRVGAVGARLVETSVTSQALEALSLGSAPSTLGVQLLQASNTAAARSLLNVSDVSAGAVGTAIVEAGTSASAKSAFGLIVAADLASAAVTLPKLSNTIVNAATNVTPAVADQALIEDSSDGNANKKARLDEIAALALSNSGYASNLYYTGFHRIDIANTMALAADTIYVTPLPIGTLVTPTRIGIDVTTISTGAGTLRLGIYNAVNSIPTTVVVDGGTVSSTSTGEKEVTISQSLEPGHYFFAVAPNLAATVQGNNLDDIQGFFIGYEAKPTGAVGTTLSSTSTSAPAALPTWPSTTRTENSTARMPSMWFRVV